VHIDCFGPRSQSAADYAGRWAPVARGGVEYHAVVGTEHDNWQLVFLTRPHVQSIASELRSVIDARLHEVQT
jgi:hypothetical protein